MAADGQGGGRERRLRAGVQAGSGAQRSGPVLERACAGRGVTATVLGETAAVKVTDWPKTNGLELDVSEVVVVAWTVKVADVVWTLVAETLCAPAVAPAGTLKEQAP